MNGGMDCWSRENYIKPDMKTPDFGERHEEVVCFLTAALS